MDSDPPLSGGKDLEEPGESPQLPAANVSRHDSKGDESPPVLSCLGEISPENSDSQCALPVGTIIPPAECNSVSPADLGGHDSGVSLQVTGAFGRDSFCEANNTVTDASSVTVMLEAPQQDICRICHSEGDFHHPLIQPCMCSGSLRFVHHPCLQKWILESSTRSCELCRFQFIMSSESKPFSKWRKLDLSSVERRRVICSVSFHLVALICVVWSLWVLLERTADEVNRKYYGWAFYTKLVVVTVGFTGGVVFMYVQCKMYMRLCRRWRTYNRIIYIQDRRPPGQRFCEGATGSENSQSQAAKVVVLVDSTVSPPVCKQPCCAGNSSVSDNVGANNAATATGPVQSNSVTIYSVL